jgi:hypothetical protein
MRSQDKAQGFNPDSSLWLIVLFVAEARTSSGTHILEPNRICDSFIIGSIRGENLIHANYSCTNAENWEYRALVHK